MTKTPATDQIGTYLTRLMKFQQLFIQPSKITVGATPSRVVWRKGKMKLLSFESSLRKKWKPPLLIVYALINRPYILDLQPGRSVVEALMRKGFDVYMIDWGVPTKGDRFLTQEDYIERYIDPCVDRIREMHGVGKISLMGYCIGGTLTVIYSALNPEKVQNLIVMASPIDFEQNGNLLNLWTAEKYFDAKKVTKAFGNVPGELFSYAFLLLNPVSNLHMKYLGLLERIEDDDYVEMFLRMEKWVYDGVPVSGAFYEELIGDWYQKNLLINNQLRIGDRKVDMRSISMPILTIVGKKDHIVPPDSTQAILNAIASKDKQSFAMDCGHIGLSVGGTSHKELWPQVGHWLRQHSHT